jgi:RimJ/RimL family protein N-acetyltransferase
MKGPEIIETERLVLRKPKASDAQAIFDRYAADREVTRYLSWPTHRSVADTLAFLAWSDQDWDRWPAGSYLVFAQSGRQLLGGTGLSFKSPTRAITGYVFARDAWGHGYATESLQAMVGLASETGVGRLEAICHVDHRPSAKVLEKCGFTQEEVRREHFVFPNLGPQKKSDVFSYVRLFGTQNETSAGSVTRMTD